MLYMDNVNRLVFWVLIPLVILFYIAFRLVEWHFWDDSGPQLIAERHSVNLRKSDDLDCLIWEAQIQYSA